MRTAIVTGGSTGIGQSICEHLLADGYRVINVSRRPSPAAHQHLHNYAADLADSGATREVAERIAAEHDVTDIVHNAGVIKPALLGSVEISDLEMLTRIHIGAAITLAQACLGHLRDCGSGRIVLISSRAAMGLATRTSYSATKSGMVGMARTWALELAATGITVNVVAPGPIAETEMFHNVIPQGSEQMDQVANSIPVRRLGRPEDVSRAVQFFLAPENSFITGQTLFVCGGASIGSLAL
ncbi:MAG: SDR family NAD(P)-dependent oxidoreductase [Halieaceae bacterium]|jgi:NAD(P)-dependent dehydrogenase (short-subunit alcohol dehydrogenase family)|nr:SDR family NAD(P)-dependent oxidoreductase [Halieaceae bacterium]